MMKRILVGLVIVASSSVWAAPAAQPWEKALFQTEPRALVAAAKTVKADDDAEQIVLFEEGVFSYDDAGRRTYRYRQVYRVLNEAGVHGAESIVVGWEPWHEERPEIRARVVTADGVAHQLDPATVEEAGASSASADMYSDRRELRAPLPAVAPGAVVEEEVIARDREPLFAGGTVDSFYFGRGVVVDHTRLVIEAPEKLALRFVAHKVSVKPQKTTANGRTRIVFDTGRLEPLQAVPEAAPQDAPHWPTVTFSTGKSWSEVAGRYAETFEAQLKRADAGELQKLARAAANGATDRDTVIARLLDRVRRDVRYTGVEFGQASLVPRDPSETLKRKYGDCKDQAALLVALLRASHIDAQMALLHTGPLVDVEPTLPGLGHFDHAIVYLPGAHPTWIDPTASFTRAGELPLPDQGRHALIAAASSTGLIETPRARFSDNRTVETREFFLAELGPSRVVETTETSGASERGDRRYWAEVEAKKARENLEKYIGAEYDAKRVIKWDRSDPYDLSGPLKLRLEIGEADRGFTGDDDAAVALFPASLVRHLPESLWDKDPEKRKRTEDFVLEEPFVYELRYQITPPPGFEPKALPESGVIKLGPMRFEKRFVQNPDGTVLATMRFETPKTRLTPAEIEELYSAYAELAQKPIMIGFLQKGGARLQAGQIKEALDEYRKLIALHPNEALHHDQLALALLKGGLGEAARAEAKRAVTAEPKSASAWRTLGFVLEHDLVGRDMQRGFDGPSAEAAYRKAKELDPADGTSRANLAILLEHDGDGIRYSPRAKLSEAIAEYRELRKRSDDKRWDENELYVLMWSRRWKELKEAARNRPSSLARDQFLLIALAAVDGAPAALREAAESIPEEARRRTTIQGAGQMLSQLRLYPQAVALLEAASKIGGAENAAQLRAGIEYLRRTRRYEEQPLNDSDPTSVVRRYLQLVMVGGESEQKSLLAVFTREHSKDFEGPDTMRGLIAGRRAAMKSMGVPPEMLLDIGMSVMEFRKEGDDASGWRVRSTGPAQFGARTDTFYVVREDGKYKVLAETKELELVGREALRRVDAGDLTGARKWLDWASDAVGPASGDDPLLDTPFARLWTRRPDADRALMRVAAASLMIEGHGAKQALPILQAARASEKNEDQQSVLDSAIARAFEQLNKPNELLELARSLGKRHPKSLLPFVIENAALNKLKRDGEQMKLLDQRLHDTPDDQYALRRRAWLAAVALDWPRAEKLTRDLADGGHAEAGDYNNAAWFALVKGHVDEAALDNARRAVEMSQRQNRSHLHTMAALLAEVGKPEEAVEILREAMEQGPPSDGDYYVLGRVAEQYGFTDYALADYQKVTLPSQGEPASISTYSLAQRRIAAIKKTSGK